MDDYRAQDIKPDERALALREQVITLSTERDDLASRLRREGEELAEARRELRGAVDALREWLAADDAAEADFNDQTEARLAAAVARARTIVGGR
jgi:predicted  nucleic acid-binding Zn-ribbon protein